MSKDTPQWLNGEPSYSVSITAAEALEEIQDAAALARQYIDSRDKRIRLSLAMAWLDHKLQQESTMQNAFESEEGRNRLRELLTAEEFASEEGRYNMASTAGRNVALFELRNGHTTPRSWEKDGDPYAGAYSHLAAVGFTRLGCRSYALPFIRAYRNEFPSTEEA